MLLFTDYLLSVVPQRKPFIVFKLIRLNYISNNIKEELIRSSYEEKKHSINVFEIQDAFFWGKKIILCC